MFIKIAPLLMITVNPSSHVIIDVGSNVTLTCNLDCFCSGASLSWRRGFNGTLPDNAQVSDTCCYYSTIHFLLS